jgi:hypothetical protein
MFLVLMLPYKTFFLSSLNNIYTILAIKASLF